MARAEAYRQLVEARAGGACEYCRLLEAATGVTFHIEHFMPRSRGGQTMMGNLVLQLSRLQPGEGGPNHRRRLQRTNTVSLQSSELRTVAIGMAFAFCPRSRIRHHLAADSDRPSHGDSSPYR